LRSYHVYKQTDQSTNNEIQMKTSTSLHYATPINNYGGN